MKAGIGDWGLGTGASARGARSVTALATLLLFLHGAPGLPFELAQDRQPPGNRLRAYRRRPPPPPVRMPPPARAPLGLYVLADPPLYPLPRAVP